MKNNYIKSIIIAYAYGAIYSALASSFTPITLTANDFSQQKGAQAERVWHFSGVQDSSPIVATTAPLPVDCRGVKIEILVMNNDTPATNNLSDVYRLDITELTDGASSKIITGKPKRFALAPHSCASRWLTLESYFVVKGGAPLKLALRRDVNDRSDTYEGTVSFIKMRVTPLGALPAPFIVENRPGYNSWPMMQSVGNRLICTYSRGSGHTIDEGVRDAYARTSTDGGRTWTSEVCFANDPTVGEVMIAKGIDLDGNALFWVRCWGKKSHHDLYRTKDGIKFEKISEPTLDPIPMQITDIFHVDGKLMALWFATRYKDNTPQSWGTLVSEDNGRSWKQTTIETVMKKGELPTEPCVVNLGDGRLFGLARTEIEGDSLVSQFQLTSLDGGKTWNKTRTNIRDISQSSPSLIFDPSSDLIYNYYYERGRRVIKCRVVKADDIFSRPLAWPTPCAVLTGDEVNPWDAGNVNVVEMNARHYLTYYSGGEKDTVIYVAPSPLTP